MRIVTRDNALVRACIACPIITPSLSLHPSACMAVPYRVQDLEAVVVPIRGHEDLGPADYKLVYSDTVTSEDGLPWLYILSPKVRPAFRTLWPLLCVRSVCACVRVRGGVWAIRT
jgi:hypothetical protein